MTKPVAEWREKVARGRLNANWTDKFPGIAQKLDLDVYSGVVNLDVVSAVLRMCSDGAPAAKKGPRAFIGNRSMQHADETCCTAYLLGERGMASTRVKSATGNNRLLQSPASVSSLVAFCSKQGPPGAHAAACAFLLDPHLSSSSESKYPLPSVATKCRARLLWRPRVEPFTGVRAPVLASNRTNLGLTAAPNPRVQSNKKRFQRGDPFLLRKAPVSGVKV